MPVCPICNGESCIPFDSGPKAHYTKPCPKKVGCNGVGQISDFKLKWIIRNMENGKIYCEECKGYHKVTLKEGGK